MEFSKKNLPSGLPSATQSDGALSNKLRLCCLLLIILISLLVTAKLVLSNKVFDSGKAIASVSVPEEATILSPPSVFLPSESSGKNGNEVKAQEEAFSRELDGQLKKGESLDALLSRLKVPSAAKEEVISSLRQCLDFRNLKPKDKISVRLDDQEQLHSCTYEVSPFEIYDVSRQDDSYLAARRAVQLDRDLVRISGKVTDSLFQAFSDLDEEPALVYSFADIFSSKIDFNTECRSGDYFNAIVEKYYKAGKFIGYGRILFASYRMVEDGRTFDAYSFENHGKSGYYNGKGEELGNSFLRSPVPFGRVTSRFTYHRKHPITGIVRPHLGVDLAAPIGTPIMAAADGKVIFAGRRGGFGNQVILQHGNGYKTYYGHLSRFGKGIKRGSTVSQKEIIGYVGSTGMSTGPHLDYRIQENGVFRNPFALKFKPRSILAGAELKSFQNTIQRFDRYLADYKGDRHLIEAKKITVDDSLPKILL